jgi:hypothetical protein
MLPWRAPALIFIPLCPALYVADVACGDQETPSKPRLAIVSERVPIGPTVDSDLHLAVRGCPIPASQGRCFRVSRKGAVIELSVYGEGSLAAILPLAYIVLPSGQYWTRHERI